MTDEAVPFAVSLALVGVGAACSFLVSHRATELIASLNSPYRDDGTMPDVPVHLTPSALGATCGWAADCAQVLTATAAPPISALMIIDSPGQGVVIGYTFAFVVGLVLFASLLYVRPDRYERRTRAGISLVSVMSFGVNALALATVSVLSS